MQYCFYIEDKIDFLKKLRVFLKTNREFSLALAKVIKTLRESRNISQEKMTYYLATCSVDFLNKCENGEVDFPAYKLLKISEVLEIDLRDLYNIITTLIKVNKRWSEL